MIIVMHYFFKGTITIAGAGDNDAARHCALFTIRESEINNTELENAKDIDIVMPM